MASLVAPIRARFQRRWKRWLNQRIKPVSSITLDQKRIFIFPTGAGILFGIMLFVMLLTAINYQNNSIYLLVFFLAGLFVVTIHATFTNMAGLTIVRLPAEPGFAGEEICFKVALRSKHGEAHQSIQLGWPGRQLAIGSLGAVSEQVIHLYLRAPRRGLMRPNRILVKSYYPLGLIRTWSWIDLGHVLPGLPSASAARNAATGNK